MIRKVLLNYHFRKRLSLIEQKRARYNEVTIDEAIYDYQLRALNVSWQKALASHPFYREWQRTHALPETISSISDLEHFPVLRKSDIANSKEMILKALSSYKLTATGGTSGITTNFPTSSIDADDAYANGYLGRSWWGIKPFDPILLFWGHSHLFGTGWRGYIEKARRRFFDYLLGMYRISCYELNADTIQRFYDAIVSTRPTCIISYASNIFKIYKYMENKDLVLKEQGLKAIIVTSETTSSGDVEKFSKRFNTNIVQEYGMAETGPIGYSFKTPNIIRILWDSFLITVDEVGNLYLNTIGPKLFPLFNYDVEDVVVAGNMIKKSVLSLLAITGKQRDILTIPGIKSGDRIISSIFFDHLLKYYPHIYSVQYRQKQNGIDILLTSDRSLNTADIRSYLQQESKKEFADLDLHNVSIVQIEKTIKTIAGKEKKVISGQ